MNKVVLITGAGTGIGRATSLLFAKEGASVALMGRRVRPITRVSEEILRRQGIAFPIAGDITDEESIQQVMEAVIKRFKRIDVLINNAGVAGEALKTHEISDRIWNEMIDFNLTGPFRMIRAVLPHFIKRRKGVIVNVSSMAALVGLKNMAAYSAAKSGLIALTRSVAVEYGSLGIRCNCICPGTVETEMTRDYLGFPGRDREISSLYPIKRIAKPEEIARGILYLASDDSSSATGTVLVIDGGYTSQ